MLVASVMSTDRLSVRSTDGLILDLIYLKIHWHRQTCHVVYRIPMQDHKILHKTESGIPSKYMLHKDLVTEIRFLFLPL
jgi:hypothetical protein